MSSVTMNYPNKVEAQEIDANGCHFTSLNIYEGNFEISVFFKERQCGRDMAQVFDLYHGDPKHRADKLKLLKVALDAVDTLDADSLTPLSNVAQSMLDECCYRCGVFDTAYQPDVGCVVCDSCLDEINAEWGEAKQSAAEDAADAAYERRCVEEKGA